MMYRLRLGILLGGFIVLFLTLAAAAWPLHKGTAHPIDERAVAVYVERSDPNVSTIPVRKVSGVRIVETGARVHVYLNYSYEDSMTAPIAIAGLKVISLTLLVFLFTFLIEWMAGKRRDQ